MSGGPSWAPGPWFGEDAPASPAATPSERCLARGLTQGPGFAYPVSFKTDSLPSLGPFAPSRTERPWPWAPSPGAAAVPRWVSGRFHTGALTRGDERHGGTRAEVLPQALPPSPGNSRARGSREGGPRQRQVRRGEARTAAPPGGPWLRLRPASCELVVGTQTA